MKVYVFLVFVLFVGHSVFSQNHKLDLPSYSIHSPDVTSLGLYNEYPVDISTGVPTIKVPLYTVRTGRLELPISISYHASGIRVDQESSSVGLGWVLRTGGAITRIKKDIPDDDYNGFLNTGNLIPDYNSIHNDLPAGSIGNSPELITAHDRDKEPDQFDINSPILNGQFCLDSTLQFSSMDMDPLKYNVDLNNNIMEITDKKGTLFRFGKSLSNEDAFETTNLSSTSLDENTGSYTTINSNYSSSWHLTEIISSDRSDTIYLKYKTHVYTNSKVINVSRQTMYDGNTPQIDATGVNFEGTTRTTLYTGIHNTRILDKILFKNGTVEFSTATDRLDSSQGVALELRIPRITGMTVYDYLGNRIKKILFDNDHYFNRTGNGTDLAKWIISDKRKKSLKLKAVKFYDRDEQFVHDYKFQYDETVPLPPINTTSQDFWGYYNGKSNSSIIPHTFYLLSSTGRPMFIGADRESNIDYMKAGTLNRVIYPTGGHTHYEYEPHYYLEEQQANGMTEKTMSKKLFAINRSTSCDPDFMNGVPADNTLNFVVSQELGSTGNSSETTVGKLYVMFSDYKYTQGQSMTFELTEQETGMSYSFSHSPSEMGQVKVFNANITLREGNTYRMEAKTNGVSGSDTSMCDSPMIEAGITYTYWDPATGTEILPKQAGGLRIRTISSFGNDQRLLTRKQYKYGDSEYGPNGIGTGRLITDPSKNFYNYPLLYAATPNTKVLKNALFFTSNSQVELGMRNGSPVDYTKVTETMVSLGEEGITNGKTEYYYSQTGRIPDISRSSVRYPYNFFEYPSWNSSVLDSVVQYRQDSSLGYTPVRKVEYGYWTFPEQRIKTLKLINNEPDIYYGYITNDHWAYYADNPNRFYYYNFYISRGRKVKNKETVVEYGDGKEIDRTEMAYAYANPKHMEVTTSITTSSSGEKTIVEYRYPDDVESLNSLEAPIISVDEMTAIGRLKSDALHRISEPIQIKTKVKDSNDALLSEFTKRNSYRIWGDYYSVFPEFVKIMKGTYSISNPMENRLSFHRYDLSGNPLELSFENGPSISYIWGSKYINPLAKIENASYSMIESLPGFGIGFAVEGNALGEGLEDTLRTHGSMANTQVTTFEFSPLIGLTTIRNPNGLGIHYYYDRFNRLKSVRDDQDNFVSDYDYNYFND